MSLYDIGEKVGRVIVSMLKGALEKQQKLQNEAERSYLNAKNLSDEELKNRIRRNEEKGIRDAKALGLIRELAERKEGS